MKPPTIFACICFRTAETVNYPTEEMAMTIGPVDEGTWQNFDGSIDEVRTHSRGTPDALPPALAVTRMAPA